MKGDISFNTQISEIFIAWDPGGGGGHSRIMAV